MIIFNHSLEIQIIYYLGNKLRHFTHLPSSKIDYNIFLNKDANTMHRKDGH